MVQPSTLLALAVTLRPRSVSDRSQLALLAGRLGFESVWTRASGGYPDHEELALLSRAAQPARIGLVLDDLDPAGMAALVAMTRERSIAVELPARVAVALRTDLGDLRAANVQLSARADDEAAGLDAAGLVVHSTDRTATQALLSTLAERRATAGLSATDLPLTVSLPVSIGRTMSEAEARALRDRNLADPDELRAGGLFGTFEDAQRQVLALRRAGADVLRVTLADEHDVADLLAQVRALAVGPTPLLHARVTTADDEHDSCSSSAVPRGARGQFLRRWGTSPEPI